MPSMLLAKVNSSQGLASVREVLYKMVVEQRENAKQQIKKDTAKWT